MFTIIVVTDSAHGPHGGFGGPVSGPVFKRIAEAALRYYGVPPTINPPPPLLVARHDATPEEEPTSAQIEAPPIVTTVSASTGGASTIPELTGMSARDALHVLAKLGVTARLHGAGSVAHQQPPAGAPIESGMDATLWLERQPSQQIASARRP
jgi:cell division protein FtsI (penicillin-binding protein 3)